MAVIICTHCLAATAQTSFEKQRSCFALYLLINAAEWTKVLVPFVLQLPKKELDVSNVVKPKWLYVKILRRYTSEREPSIHNSTEPLPKHQMQMIYDVLMVLKKT